MPTSGVGTRGESARIGIACYAAYLRFHCVTWIRLNARDSAPGTSVPEHARHISAGACGEGRKLFWVAQPWAGLARPPGSPKVTSCWRLVTRAAGENSAC